MILEIIKQISDAIDKVFPVNLFVVTKSGNIRWANERMLQCSGISELKSIKGKSARIFGEEALENTKEVIESNKIHTLYEQANGKNFISMKIPYRQGGFNGVAGLSIDITGLEQAERAKREFTMNMGHEIRTPFCGIVTILELLYTQEKDIKKKDLLEMSLYSSRRLLDFMNDIQEVSRLGYLPLDKEVCDMKSIVKNIVIFLIPSIKMKGLKIEVSCTDDDIMINRYRIEKILLNILGNAVKFTEQGTIKVSIKTSPILTLVVSDTGIGIDTKYHEKIFEDFFQVVSCYKKNDYAGVGKGLYLVKKYTEELNGRITVKSELGQGATFQVVIPLSSE